MAKLKGRRHLRYSRGLIKPQDSPLLNLPPELRNTIYEYTAQHTDSISLRQDRISYSPSLSLVCRQIREEYHQIYHEEAPRYASKVTVRIVNFKHRSVARNVDHLPAPAPGGQRKYFIHILLTNVFRILLHSTRWDRYLQQLRVFTNGDVLGQGRKYDVQIYWDPETSKTGFCHENFSKLKFCFPNCKSGGWPQVCAAFEEAFEKYRAPVQSNAAGMKRKPISCSGVPRQSRMVKRKRNVV